MTQHLDQFLGTSSDTDSVNKTEQGLGDLFAQSALYELHQSAFGLAQTVGLQDHVPTMEQLKAADSWIGQHAQIVGRGVGNFLPTVAVALTTRFAAGRAMEHFGIGSENLVLKRSAIGFSTAESAATGLVTGALLKPTDDTVAHDWGSFVLDRAKGGASGALTYGALNLTALGWKSIAESKFAANLGADTVLKNSFVTGAISGLPGGFVSIQADSLMNEGRLSTDMNKIGQSAYEMGVVGALLGATTSGLSRLSKDSVS